MPNHIGRYRAPRYSPPWELGSIESVTAHPAARGTAIAVLTAGLIAGMVASAGAATAPSVTLESRSVAAPATPSPDTFGTVGFTTKVVARPAAAPAAAPARATTQAPARTTPARAATPAPRAAAKPAAPAAPSIPADGSIIGIARSLSGIPYRYGGSSPSGFDCSGFTSYVYRMAGKSIPRTASGQQAAATRVISPSPGDLMFFGTPAYHAGIYAGNGMMYDSQRPGTTTGLHSIWTTSGVTYGRF